MWENGKKNKNKNTTFDIYACINNIFNGLILKTNYDNQEKYANTTAFYS